MMKLKIENDKNVNYELLLHFYAKFKLACIKVTTKIDMFNVIMRWRKETRVVNK